VRATIVADHMQRVFDRRRRRRFAGPEIEQEIDDQAFARGDRTALRAGDRIPGAEMRHHARERRSGKRKLRRSRLGLNRVEDVGPLGKIRDQHFVNELGRAVLDDRRRKGEEGGSQLRRARVTRGGRMSESRGGESQQHQARKGHLSSRSSAVIAMQLHTSCCFRRRGMCFVIGQFALNHGSVIL
jgi:hypothetical protein